METDEQKEKRLRMNTARIADACDYDWSYFLDHLEELEEFVERAGDSILRNAGYLVIMQVYLNKMNRYWEDLENSRDERGSEETTE